MNDPTEAALFAAVCEEPENHALKLMLADRLQEQGDPRWEAWAWLGVNGKMPAKSKTGWYSEEHSSDSISESSLVPQVVFHNLPARHRRWATFTNADCYSAAVAAFLAARRDGWTPEPAKAAP